jgi:hypothetical protein
MFGCVYVEQFGITVHRYRQGLAREVRSDDGRALEQVARTKRVG